MPRSKYVCAFVIFLGFSANAHADLGFQSTHKLDAFVKERMQSRPSAGLSVAYSHGDKAFSAAFGFADIEKKISAKPETVYRLASVTKMFTATAILQLRDAGKLRLSDTIGKHLPRYPRQGRAITIRQLLGHLSGIPHYSTREGPKGAVRRTHLAEDALRIFSSKPLVARPGEKYVYTSNGYNILGAIIEVVTGMDFEQYLRTNIFTPSGMTSTELDDPAIPRAKRAKGYRPLNGTLASSANVNVLARFGGGGTRGDVLDMVRFGRALLSGKYVSAETFSEMQLSMVDGAGLITDYGMGMAVYPLQGRPVIAHAGQQPETSTLLLIYPADDLVVALATNVEEQGGLLFEVAGYLAETLLQDGIRRRTVSGATLDKHLYASDISEVMNRGLDGYLRGHRYNRDDSQMLIRSFHCVRGVMAQVPNVCGLRDEGERGMLWAPETQYAFNVVGAHMAAVLARVNGRSSLRRYHVEGPFAFLNDYVSACEKIGCSPAYRIEESGVSSRAKGWKSVYLNSDLKRFVVAENMSVDEVRTTLAGLKPVAFRPNIAPDILDIVEKTIRAGDQSSALAWAKLAYEYFPNEAKVVIALAEVEAVTKPGSGKRFLEALKLPGGKKRLSEARMKYRASVLRRAGLANAALTALRGTVLVHPKSRAARIARDRQTARMKK